MKMEAGDSPKARKGLKAAALKCAQRMMRRNKSDGQVTAERFSEKEDAIVFRVSCPIDLTACFLFGLYRPRGHEIILQVSALHTKLLSVCREACEARADYMHFPEHWLFHHR